MNDDDDNDLYESLCNFKLSWQTFGSGLDPGQNLDNANSDPRLKKNTGSDQKSDPVMTFSLLIFNFRRKTLRYFYHYYIFVFINIIHIKASTGVPVFRIRLIRPDPDPSFYKNRLVNF